MARRGGGRGSVAVAGQGGTPGTQVGNTYPQTTRGQGATFPELSRIAERTGYQVGLGSNGWGQTIDQPLAASPGYYRYLDLSIYALSGANATTTAFGVATTAAGVDFAAFPGSIFNNVLVRDAAGNTIYSLTDPMALFYINTFSGQAGVLEAADPRNLPSYTRAGVATSTATSTATTNTGNFIVHQKIPFEIAHGTAYGTIAAGAANLQPSLHLGIQPSASVFATAPGTLPTLTVQVDENYWAAVPGMTPPDLGTSLQWQQLTANPSVTSGSGSKITLGKTEGYITTLILIFRDASGYRSDFMLPGGVSGSATAGSPFGNVSGTGGGVGNRIQLWVDSVLVLDEDINVRMDKMFEQFPAIGAAITPASTATATAAVHGGSRLGGNAFEGVLVYTFRNSVSQAVLGPDSGELWTPSTPGTLLEIGATNWGTFTAATTGYGVSPGSITALIGSIVPGPEGIQQGIGNVVP
jgi:hypothetical protein